MRVIIIEDEVAAARRLNKLLLEIDPKIEVVAISDSIESSITLLCDKEKYDLIFMDIHLADGSSFEIFKQIEIEKPVVFITAYDEYAIQAFKVNATDYILKPVKKAELEAAYLKMQQSANSMNFDYKKLLEAVRNNEFTKRFLIRIGQQIKVVELKDAAYFYTEDKITFVVNKIGKRYPLDYSLEKLEEIINPGLFFRINRQFIVNIDAIKEMISYSKSRVKLSLKPPCDLETIVSTERSPHFKKWLVGEV